MFSDIDRLYSTLVIPRLFADVEYDRVCGWNGFVGSGGGATGMTMRLNSSTAISQAPVEIDCNKNYRKMKNQVWKTLRNLLELTLLMKFFGLS